MTDPDPRWWSAVDALGSPPTVMVNRTFAETFFAEGGALGERVGIFGTDQIEIIGVVGDSRFNGLDEAELFIVTDSARRRLLQRPAESDPPRQ